MEQTNKTHNMSVKNNRKTDVRTFYFNKNKDDVATKTGITNKTALKKHIAGMWKALSKDEQQVWKNLSANNTTKKKERKEKKKKERKDKKTMNRGTGAGGSGTNKTGLTFECMTDLETEWEESDEVSFAKKIVMGGEHFVYTSQCNFAKYLDDKMDKSVKALHGAKKPDECYIHEETNRIFIIEKKHQNVGGSKCECIQTAVSKKRNLQRRFPTYSIVYMYCLSDWFKTNCEAELEDLEEDGIPVFWGNDIYYKKDIIKFMTDYE